MTDENPWAWWQTKLAGGEAKIILHTPEAGFYRWEKKGHYQGKRWGVPVGYWLENGVMRCRVAGKDVTPEYGADIWNTVAENPVRHAWYIEVIEGDVPLAQWPDGMSTIQERDNTPPDSENSYEWLKDRIEDLAREAEERIKGPPVADQDEADRIANLADRLAELHAKADEGRRDEKRPFDNEAERVQKKWLPLIHAAEAFKNLKKILTPWQQQQKQAAKLEAEAAAAAGAPPPETRSPRAGTRGRAQTLRTFKRAEITDYEACLAHFKDDTAIRIAVQGLADKVVRAGGAVPGAKLIEEERTV